MSATVELLTVDELAEHLRVRPSTIRLWAREGLIPAVRIGAKVIRFDLQDVMGVLKHGPQEAAT